MWWGSTGSGAGGAKEAPQFAGNYRGFEFLQLSGPGGTFPIGALPLSVTIANDGTVVVTDASGIQYRGKLGGVTPGRLPPNKFIAMGFVLLPTPPGVQCNPGTLGYIGTVVGIRVSGNVTGRFLCSALGRSAILVLGGAFTATKGAPGVVGPGVTAPSPQAPTFGGLRKSSRKQSALRDAMDSAF